MNEEDLALGNYTSAAQRQARLLETLRIEGFADAQVLKDTLGVSIATIRRDLSELEERRLLRRTHGGATIVNQATFDTGTPQREVMNVEEKSRIGAAAAELIVSGDAVLLDSGTTTLQVAKRIASTPSLTFVTNGTDTLAALVAGGARNIHVIGGEYVDINRSTGGSMAADHVRRFAVDTAVLSVSSVDVRRGLISTLSPQLGAVQQAMIEIARTVIVVADHTKFERSGLSVIASLKEIDHIVTDGGARGYTASLPEAIKSKIIYA